MRWGQRTLDPHAALAVSAPVPDKSIAVLPFENLRITFGRTPSSPMACTTTLFSQPRPDRRFESDQPHLRPTIPDWDA